MRLREFFLPMDIEVIQSIPICTRRIEDFWSWHFERTDIFTVRSAYRTLVEIRWHHGAWLDETASTSNQVQEEKEWTSLWKIRVPAKIRVFLWRLAKHSIPTGDVRHRRNMAPDSSCSLCGEQDSWRHSLLECTMSRCVWALAPESVTEHMEHTTEPEAKQWLFTMMHTLKGEDLTRCLVTLWAIWFARRKAIHEGIFQSPLSTYYFIESFIRDLELLAARKSTAGSQVRRMPPARWLAPP